MKKIIINFFDKHKKILFLMLITFVLFIADIFLMLLTIVNNQEAITNFIETQKITNEILPFTILSFIGIGLGIILCILTIIFAIKTIISDKKTLSTLIMKDEINFLLELPKKIKKEVLKNGK